MSTARSVLTRRAKSPRTSALFLGGLILLVLLLGGSVSTFGLSQALAQHERAATTLNRLYLIENAVFQSEVAFKRQIQEWKDLLLRGRDAEAFAHYRAAFLQQAEVVGAVFRELEGHPLTADEKGQLAQLMRRHQDITEQYLGTLEQASSLSPERAYLIDQAVRGIDRDYMLSLDAYVAGVEERIQSFKAQQGIEEHDRYQQLRTLLIAITVMSLLLVLALLWALYPRPAH